MKTNLFSFLLSSTLIFVSCGNQQPAPAEEVQEEVVETTEGNETTALIMMEKEGIKLTEMVSPEFSDANLSLTSPTEGTAITEGKNHFQFAVENYELGNQTSDAEGKMCANSGKGQHIHFIVNNRPYEANYTNEFDSDLDEGNNVMLAFLSRSYHESIKTNDAYVLTQFATEGTEVADLSGEHLFYSRPKGTYIGKDTEQLMLDFFLVNTSISETGNKVIATINGVEFTITKWVPYLIEGLPKGELTVQLKLVDAEGNLVEGPFNDSGVRTVALKEAAEDNA